MAGNSNAALQVEAPLDVESHEGNIAFVNEAIEAYRLTSFTLTMTLLQDESVAKEVVEEVFIRLHNEHHEHQDADLETLVHRFTYMVALERMACSDQKLILHS